MEENPYLLSHNHTVSLLDYQDHDHKYLNQKKVLSAAAQDHSEVAAQLHLYNGTLLQKAACYALIHATVMDWSLEIGRAHV